MTRDGEIIAELDLPITSFRLFALERAIQTGSSEALLAALTARSSAEDDPECRLLLQHAIHTVRARIGGKIFSGNASPGSVPPAFPDMDPFQKLHFLNGLPEEGKAGHLQNALSWLETETDPLIVATIITRFARCWPADKVTVLQRFLNSHLMTVRFAAIEALCGLHPKALEARLPQLLIHPDPRTQALAIKGLAAIDLKEAISHIEHNLLHLPSPQKTATLKICIFLPFAELKPVLLRFMASEQDLEFLEKAGLLFQHNPDGETPFRLWEIAEDAPPAKQNLLKTIIRGACQVLKDSGLMTEEYPKFVEKLQSWIQVRSFNRLLQEFVGAVQADQPDGIRELEDRIRLLLEKPHLRKAWSAALSWPMPDAVRGRFSALLAEKPDIAQVPVPIGKPKTFDELSLDEKILWVSTCNEEDRASLTACLKKAIPADSEPEDLRATCLRAACRLNDSSFVGVCLPLLNRKNPNLVAAAIEYMGTFDPENLFAQIGKFLQSPVARIKIAAVKMLKKQDVSQAISSMKALLSQPDPVQQKLALSCMIHFDFFLVRPVLAEYLKTCPDPDLLKVGFCFFLANPDVENLYVLFQIGKTLPPEQGNLLRETRKSLEAELTQSGILSPGKLAKLPEEFEERWQKECEKRDSGPRPYSVRHLHGTAAGFSWGALAAYMEENRSTVLMAVLGIGAILLCFWLMSGYLSSGYDHKGKIRSGALPAQVNTADLRIGEIRLQTGRVLAQADDGTRFLLLGERSRLKGLTVGNRVKVRFVPFRKTPDGLIVGTLRDCVLGTDP
jgi:HEAT repeat protein